MAIAFQKPLSQEQWRARITGTLADHWKWLLIQGIILEVLGVLAIVLPILSTLAIDIFIGWLFLIGGFVRVVTLVRARHVPGYWWALASGALALVVGALLVVSPGRGVLSLTMLLALVFLVGGIANIFSAFDFRHHARNWGWRLFSGIVDLLLVFLIWYGWPGTAAWAIGVLVGVNLLLFGMSEVMLSIAVKPAAPRA